MIFLEIPDGHHAVVQSHGDGTVAIVLGNCDPDHPRSFRNWRAEPEQLEDVMCCPGCSAELVMQRIDEDSLLPFVTRPRFDAPESDAEQATKGAP